MVKLSAFIGMCIFLLIISGNVAALSSLDYEPYLFTKDINIEFANVSEYSDIEYSISWLTYEEKVELIQKQRSFIVLIGIVFSIFAIFCLTLLIGFYVSEKKREKNEKE